ncbi:MAG: hypothetical protein JO332_02375 [Planctomycetaceae bacterium]|nr:hypothetical protein [Planctomycetaceae bacterium]
MEQPETPQAPAPNPEAPAPAPRPELPDPKGALPIPDHFRLPFHGMMSTPTAVPSATERRYNLSRMQQRRRRRSFLIGLLAGQLLIIAMDLGGAWFLRTHPQVKLQAPVGVPAVVFLGMAIGAAAMIGTLGLIFAVLGLRGLFGRRQASLATSTGHGIRRVVQTVLALGVSMAVILGTAWFMIPGAEWKPTVDFAKGQGRKAVERSKAQLRSMLHPSASR